MMGMGMDTRRSQALARHEVETKPQETPLQLHVPKATNQDCFSDGRDINIKHPLEVSLDYKKLDEIFNIKSSSSRVLGS